MKRARALNAGRNLDGSAVAAATGRAAASLSAPMIDVIVDMLRQIPAEHREDAEQHHLALAEDAGHKQVAALGARIVAHLDPDGSAPDDTEPTTSTRELLRFKRLGLRYDRTERTTLALITLARTVINVRRLMKIELCDQVDLLKEAAAALLTAPSTGMNEHSRRASDQPSVGPPLQRRSTRSACGPRSL
ncbi:MAG TPA: hypothetical protein VGL47_11540 [Amycolatopsis sp.]|uniref:hypothetical protein n=1 Tax=Amycolatopsis sp. TaxID=37632 RepID=UPI002F3FA5CF